MPKFLKHSFIFLFIIGCNLNESVNKDLEDCVNSNCESSDNCSSSFDFNISVQTAAFFFKFVTINDELIDNADWVGAFNGDVCVGKTIWDTSGFCSNNQFSDKASCESADETWVWNQCNSGICEVMAMGSDGSEMTSGYLQFGDMPTFKIYDVSEGKVYDATIKNSEGLIINSPQWQNGTFPLCDSLIAIQETVFDCINY